MKLPIGTMTLFALLAMSPALAQNADMNSMAPTLTFPDPAPEPVTKNDNSVKK